MRDDRDKFARAGGGSSLSKLERLLGRYVRPLPVDTPSKNKRVKKRKKTVI